MKYVVSGLVLFGICVFAGFTVIITAPYYYYNKAINNEYHGAWYSLDSYKSRILGPTQKIKIKKYDHAAEDRWKKLQFGSAKISIPIANPQYTIKTIMKYNSDRNSTQKGIEIIRPNGLVLGRILLLPNGFFAKDYHKQKIFKLPVVQKLLASYDYNKVWKDLFTFEISSWNIPFESMIYNLYLLYKRSITLPPGFKSFGTIDGEKMLTEIKSNNKDFKVEVIQICRNRKIYSLLTQWRLESEEAEKVRSKVYADLDFEPSSKELTSFIYKEFQSLPHSAKIDHEGLAYLYSAWTHSTENPLLIRSMVGYLERGHDNEQQLAPIYEYASQRFGTTYSSKEVDVGLTGEALLRKKIEMENLRENEERERQKQMKFDAPANLSPEEQMYLDLEEAKKKRQKAQAGQIIMN